MTRREKFMTLALQYEGRPYVWGSDGLLHRNGGELLRCFDCSGLVCFCLKAVGGPDWSASHNSDRMFHELPVTTEPKPGDLAFYGREPRPGAYPIASHVMLWVGDGRVYGSCGGDSATRNIATALGRRARVMFKPSHEYRTDFIGFRTLTPLDPEPAP